MTRKIEIEHVFIYWRNVDEVIFDIVVKIDNDIILDGTCTYNIRVQNYNLSELLTFQLNQIKIMKEVIEFGLDTKNYDFTFEDIKIFKKKLYSKDINLPENFDYSYPRKSIKNDEEIAEIFPQKIFNF